jgi:hypothetical protein
MALRWAVTIAQPYLVGGWSNGRNKRSVTAPVAERPWRQPIKRRRELKEGADSSTVSVYPYDAGTTPLRNDLACCRTAGCGNCTSTMHTKISPCQQNMSHVTISCHGQCASILTENQVDPRKSMKHESTCRVQEDMAEAIPPTKGHLGRVASLAPIILFTKISARAL